MTERLRREDDKRFNDLDVAIKGVAKDVSTIREMLISEPEASPLGRSLLKMGDENRRLIHEQRVDFEALKKQHRIDFETFKKEEFDPIDDWWQQSKGAWRAVLGAAVVLGIIGTFFGLLAYFH